MMAMLLMVAGLTYGQNIIRDYAPHTKRGELPPAWIKNKVTPCAVRLAGPGVQVLLGEL